MKFTCTSFNTSRWIELEPNTGIVLLLPNHTPVLKEGIGVWAYLHQKSLWQFLSSFGVPWFTDGKDPPLIITDPEFAALAAHCPIPEPIVDWLLENAPDPYQGLLGEVLGTQTAI